MATIDYPSSLPEFRMGKSRSQQQTYRTTTPFAGPLFTQKVTDQSPVLWEVTITCVGSIQSRIMQAFLRQVANGTPFNKKILTEEGFIEHEVKWVNMPLSPTQISSTIFEYSGSILAAKLIQNDADIDDELIIEWLGDSSLIDITINDIWPE